MFGFANVFGSKSSSSKTEEVKNKTVVVATGSLGELFRSGAFGQAIADVNFACDHPKEAKAAEEAKAKAAAAAVAAEEEKAKEAKAAEEAKAPKAEQAQEATTPEPTPTPTPAEAAGAFFGAMRHVSETLRAKVAEAAKAEEVKTPDATVEVTVTKVTVTSTDKPTMAEEVIQAAELIRTQMATVEGQAPVLVPAVDPFAPEAKVVEVLSAGDLADAAEKLAAKHQTNGNGKKK